MGSSGGAAAGGAGALTLIESQTLAAPAASITFSAIPQTYKDLLITYTGRSTTAAASLDTLLMQCNADVAANYDYHNFTASGTAAAMADSFGQAAIRCGLLVQANAPAGLCSSGQIWIYAYTSAFQKAIWAACGSKIGVAAANLRNEQNADFWRSTAAITSLLLKPGTNSFDVGAIVNLWGVG